MPVAPGRLAPCRTTLLDVQALRRRFSSLQGDFVFLDAPGGSQVPDEVGDAIARALRDASANIGALYETSHRAEAILDAGARGRRTVPRTAPSDDVIFGQNMTVLDFRLSRTASRDWKEGDRILVSRLDHDGGVAPWVELAEDRGFDVDWIDVTEDLRLDLDDLERKLDDRVRVVACVASSNAVGTIIDVARVSELAHSVGALCWVDAVQYAAHEPVDVQALGCDVLLCSAYKFCGPHRRARVRAARAARVVAAVQGAARGGVDPVGRRFEPGTAPYELLAGFSATIAYLESLGGMEVLRRVRARARPALPRGLPDGVTVYGLQTMDGRVADVPAERRGRAGADVARRSPSAASACGRTTTGTRSACARSSRTRRTRCASGCIHYNTADEIDRFDAELAKLARWKRHTSRRLRSRMYVSVTASSRHPRAAGFSVDGDHECVSRLGGLELRNGGYPRH